MRTIRFSKVRVTDNRPPPRAGAISPVERNRATTGGSVTGLERLTASQAREIAEHDANVRDYKPETVAAAYADVCAKLRLHDLEPQELRWLKARKAALMRLGNRMRERGLA